MTATQRMRNILALAQACECGRAVPADRLALHAAAAGMAPREAVAALAELERQGLAHKTPSGWTLRSAPVTPRVSPDHARQVRLRP